MDENRVTALLVEASDEAARRPFDPADDLRRGRAAQRRRRFTATTAAALGAAAVVVLVLVLAGQVTRVQEPTETPAGTGLQPNAISSATPASSTLSSPGTSTTSSASNPTATAEPSATTNSRPGVPTDPAAFNHLLFTVAQDRLDPNHARLQWSEGFTGMVGDSLKEWGQKFGWQAPGDSGQAMVYLAVGNVPESSRLGCGQYDYSGTAACTKAVLPNGQPAQVLNSATRREVHWSRPDGTYVFAIVDATFANNTTVASHAALPTLTQLERFVIDPRLVLPPS